MNKFYPVLFLVAIVITSAILVIFTNHVTLAHLQLQQDEGIINGLDQIFQEARYYKYDDDTEIYIVYDGERNGIGYAFYAEGKGRNGKIVVFVGLVDKKTIKSIAVISHKESSSFWKLIVDNYFIEEFTGLKVEDCYLIEDGGQVDGVTRATITSQAITDIVRGAILEKIEFIN
jgi:electron transport complex protein RnfG